MDFFYYQLATMTPYKGDPPTFMDNKGERWGPALSHERE